MTCLFEWHRHEGTAASAHTRKTCLLTPRRPEPGVRKSSRGMVANALSTTTATVLLIFLSLYFSIETKHSLLHYICHIIRYILTLPILAASTLKITRTTTSSNRLPCILQQQNNSMVVQLTCKTTLFSGVYQTCGLSFANSTTAAGRALTTQGASLVDRIVSSSSV